MPSNTAIDSEPHDLVINRLVRVPRALLWKAWAAPELLKEWWCPKPWTTEVRAHGDIAGKVKWPMPDQPRSRSRSSLLIPPLKPRQIRHGDRLDQSASTFAATLSIGKGMPVNEYAQAEQPTT